MTKYYAVKKGRTPGIYRSWDEAKRQIDGFSNAEYKSFESFSEAAQYVDLKPIKDNTLANAVAKIKNTSKQLKSKPVSVPEKRSKNMNDNNYFATIYTDGGSRNTGVHKGGHVNDSDKAAWAYLIVHNGKQISNAGGRFGATNNQMELTGIIEAFKKLIALGYNEEHLHFVLDSKYVLDAINKKWLNAWKKKGWKRSGGPLKNVELWQELEKLLQQFPDSIFDWTHGHRNNEGNNFVDHKLNQFMDKM